MTSKLLVSAVATMVVAALPITMRGADPVALNVKPGLWETTVTSQVTGLPPIPADALSKLSPEQRAKAEAAIQAAGARGPRTTTTQGCVTQDDLNKAFNTGNPANQSCKTTLTNSTRSTQEIHLDCSMNGISTTGTARIQAVDSENVKGTFQFDTTGNGKQMNMNSSFNSKWIGASCDTASKKKGQ